VVTRSHCIDWISLLFRTLHCNELIDLIDSASGIVCSTLPFVAPWDCGPHFLYRMRAVMMYILFDMVRAV
jgi:hypothetical protein